MAGSNIMVNVPQSGKKHNNLLDRNIPFQHILESVYRKEDGKDLASILQEMQSQDSAVLFESFKITEITRAINLTKFTVNMAKDVLFVDLCGAPVYEGTDDDYVKTSPSQITFNYDLKPGYEIFVVLAGTISNESFGDDIHNEINQFKQLADTPKTYYGAGGKVATVNDEETGLVFKSVKAGHDLNAFEMNLTVSSGGYWEGWVPFTHAGLIKVIRVTPEETFSGNYDLSLWTSPDGQWIYYSGTIPDPNIGSIVLYDIMEIAHIDKSTQDNIYLRLNNNGINSSNFKVEIIVDI
jgi:hypothetical protein